MGEKQHGIEELSRFAIDFIRISGEEVLSFFGKGKSDLKFDKNLVTEAELHSTGLFRERLHTYFPKHRIYEDEETDEGYTHEEKRYLWIFDPLDGVANFQAGIPVWGLSLALFENNWPIFGVFYMPASGAMFHARAGGKAWWNNEVIRVSPQDSIDDESLLFTYSRFHSHYLSSFPGKIRNMGCTAAHICYVAMGRAEAAIISNESYQDLAAAWIIMKAAGGEICKMDKSPFVLGDYLETKQPGEHLLVTAPAIHEQVLDSLKKMPA